MFIVQLRWSVPIHHTHPMLHRHTVLHTVLSTAHPSTAHPPTAHMAHLDTHTSSERPHDDFQIEKSQFKTCHRLRPKMIQ